MESDHHDICRVCRSEGSHDRPLFHPCVCMGSIKFIHQDCLLQWLKYSRKEYCELCKHRFSFTPIYSPDMPKRLPIRVLIMGLLRSVGRAVRYWLHYTLVAFAWLGVVPLTACRIYRCLFTGSVSSLLTLPLDMLSTENLASDCFQGCLVVTCTLCAFIGLVWLREQILHGGGPDWLEQDNAQANNGLGAAGLLAWAQGNNRNRAANHQGAAQAGEPVEVNQEHQHMNNAGDNNGGHHDDSDNEEEVVHDEDEAVPDQEEQANEQNNAAQDDMNWNPIEWDRAAEELTWERLLGLDGSLVFLEHVFWVVSLNTLFILVFAFCPYHIGQFTVAGLKMEKIIAASHFEGLMTTLIGYIIIDVSLVNLHFLVSLAKLLRPKRILGLCHIVVKVSLLVVVEVGVFPLICGWWLDVCSLSMFDATIKDREQSFNMAPGTCMFIHWLVGMVYVFYFASFILLLREVLRPGVLWFLRNLNDPDFNPIQEMIHLPILRHVRRFLASIVIFGSVVLLMLWAPVQIIRKILPNFLPYNVMLNSDAPVSELSLELLLLQVVLPALLEQGHTRSWLKGLVKGWTICVAWFLNIRSYLLGDVTIADADEDETVVGDDQPHMANVAPADPPGGDVQAEGVGAVHQAMLQGGGPTGFQPYKRPRFFPLRVLGLITMIGLTLFLASLVCLVLPVWIGRQLMKIWMHDVKIHELYTAACGLYTCWLILRAIGVLYDWLPQGWRPIANRLMEWVILGIKASVAMVLLLGVIPLMLGVLFELVVVIPLRVPVDQSPVFFPWQDWALGVLHAKIICAITMMGPQWWLKRNMEQVYNMGLRNLNLSFILRQLCIPVIGTLGVALASPYAVVRTITKITGIGFDTENLVLRRIYPLLLSIIIILGLCIFHTRQFKRLYEHIKNDRYLVGQRLVNYERRTPPSEGIAKS